MARANPELISPTAHYTGYVWYANGYSHDAFATRKGRLLYGVLRGANLAAGAVGAPTLDGMLLARHRLIDLRLAKAIESGEVEQVIEVAAGLSPRGWRFRQRFGDRITYIEADLPDMIAVKREVLAQLGGESPRHRTAQIDALRDDGPLSIDALCAALDPSRGTAIVTEGLIPYFDQDTVVAMWQRFAAALGRFTRGLYLSDIMTRHGNGGMLVSTFSTVLGAFVKGKVHLHYDNAAQVEAALAPLGFDAKALDPREFAGELPDIERAGARHVRIIEARVLHDA